MKNAEGKLMTREEASTLLAEVLLTLAKNAVHNKRLTEYADELERYIALLDKEAPQEEKDEPKAE